MLIKREICRFILSGLMAWCTLGAFANETDQYTLPIGRDFADLRVYFTGLVLGDIEDSMELVNGDIEEALQAGATKESMEKFYSANEMASVVYSKLFMTFPVNESLDVILHTKVFRDKHPGMLTAYRPETSIYDHPGLVIDLFRIVRLLFRASTVNIDGTLLGTDKLIHFLHLGRVYQASYSKYLDRGMDPEAARARAVGKSAGNHPLLSENGFLGMATTGVRSNADLAADYAGYKFFRNLTEEVWIGDRKVPPILVLDGDLWSLNDHVNRYSDFFVQFVTPHWNEGLNPNIYGFYTDNLVAKMLQKRCPDLLDLYLDPRGNRRNREKFAALERELSMFYGEDYGWENEGDEAVSILNLCFELENGELDVPDDYTNTDQNPPDRFGRSELWWVANEGDLDRARDLLAQGADPNAADHDGETPLHAAARRGNDEILAELLAHGADPGSLALYETTPLHISVRDQKAACTRLLLEHGADANALDAFGHAPLHDAALRYDLRSARLLLAAGALADRQVTGGPTPMQLAQQVKDEEILELLTSR